MLSKTAASLVFAATCLTAMPVAFAAPADQLVTNGPQADPADHSAHWSATQNVRESAQYEHLLKTNRAFRMARMRKECGPVTDPQLHASCLATFNGDAPMSGSSTPPEPMHNSSGNNR